MKNNIILAVVAVIIIAVLVIVGVTSGSGTAVARFTDPITGISFAYPAALFPSATTTRTGIIVLADPSDMTGTTSPSLSVAVMERAADKIDVAYNFYKTGEENLIGSQGTVASSEEKSMGKWTGRRIVGAYFDSDIYFFVTKDPDRGAVIAVEMIVPEAYATANPGIDFDDIFGNVIRSLE